MSARPLEASELAQEGAPPAGTSRRPAERGDRHWLSVFAALLRRETAEHWRTRRAAVGLFICVLLCGLAAWVRTEDYRQAHRERDAFLQRWEQSVVEQMQRDENIQVENTRATSPLAVLSVGLEPILPFRFTSTKEGLRLGESRGARNMVDALFGTLDLAFVVGLLLSLLALALTFDSVCGERTSGTLAVVLSYPVPRSVLLAAKIASATIVLGACFLFGFGIVFAANAIFGGGAGSASNWLLFLAGASLYLLSFATLGVAVSTWVRRPPDAALVCVLLWVTFAFIAPRVIGIAVAQTFPPSRAVERALREDAEISQLRVAYTQRMYDAYYALVAGEDGSSDARQKDFERVRQQAAADLDRERREVLGRVRGESDREEDRRDRLTAMLTAVSPTSLFNQLASEVALTGMTQRKHAIREIRLYDDTIGRKLAESRQFFFSPTSRGGGATAMALKSNVTPYLVPFRSSWVGFGEVVEPALSSALLLAGFCGLFFAIGYVGLLRLDVRPL